MINPFNTISSPHKVTIVPAAPARWYHWFRFDLMKIPDAIVNTYRIARTVIGGRADLLQAYKRSWRRTATIYPTTTANGTTNHVIADPKIAAAVVSHFRNDPTGMMRDFENAKAFALILRDTISEPATSNSDLIESFVFTASSSFAKQYHMHILSHLQQISAEEQRETLQPLVEESISRWEQEPLLDARKAGRNFAMQSVMRLFFGCPEFETDNLQRALDCVIDRMTNDIVQRPPSEQEKRDYQDSAAIIRAAIDSILSHPKEGSILHAVSSYTPLQQKGLIFILLFAGVDTTGALINYLLYQLGKGTTVNADEIRKFIEEGIQNHAPAPIIGRYPREPITIQMEDAKGHTTYYTVRPPDGLLVVPELAPQGTPFSALSFFGGGPHLCPGRNLAFFEVELLLRHLLQHYAIRTEAPHDFSSSALVVRKAPPAMVRLTPLHSHTTSI